MFSPLARGSANWDGGIHLEQHDDQILSDDLLLPQIHLKSSQQTKSLDISTAYSDGQLQLPKTFVTRKGALLLFTPSEELLSADPSSPRSPSDVYEDGLKLKTIGNLASSVLQFGKEEEQAWEGIPSTPTAKGGRRSQGNPNQPIKDRKAFLHFLHYLDSESLTADKHAQPGCAPEFYLDELKTSSRVLSSRTRSNDVQTPYSFRTYASLLEDDEMSDIVREYIKWHKLEKQLQQEQMGKDRNEEDDEDFQNPELEQYTESTSPNHHGYVRRSHSMPPQSFYGYEDTLRPSTAPIPPAPESPRANPRITSGKRLPPKRVLGSTPEHLDKILRADINTGRNVRRGPSPRLKFSRNTSPTFYGSSRAGSPEHGMMPRYETPMGRSEGWSRAEGIIQEVEESEALPTPPTRPVSVASYSSAHSSKVKDHSIKTLSNIGTTKDIEVERSTNMGYASRSASMSSVSYQKGVGSVSGKSRDHPRSLSRSSNDYHDDDGREIDKMTSFSKDDSFVLRAPPPSARMTSRCTSAPKQYRTVGLSTSLSNTQNRDENRVTLPSRDVVTQSMSRASGVSSKRSTSRMSSKSQNEQSPDVQKRDDVPRGISRASGSWGKAGSRMSAHENSASTSPVHNEDLSRVMSRESIRLSKAGSRMSKESRNGEFDTLNDFGGQGMQLRSRSAASRKPTPPTRVGSGNVGTMQSRPVSAPISVPGDGTNATVATLGSEADIADVTEGIPRHHDYIDDSDDERDLDTPDIAWPVNADGELEMSGDELSEYGSAAEEVNLDLPPSPALTSSGFFRLGSTWSHAPQLEIEKTDELTTENLVPQEPSETGATGFQSRSPSPTPKMRTPAAVITGAVDDNSSIDDNNDDNEEQWPPEMLLARPPTPLTKPVTPIPTLTINKDETDSATELLRPTTSSAMYQETIDIEKSRPNSPVTELERQQFVPVSETVTKYLETAHEPVERPRSGRGIKTPEVDESPEIISDEESVVETAPAMEMSTEEQLHDKTITGDKAKEKPKSAAQEKTEPKITIQINNAKDRPKTPQQKQQEPTLEETEARRDYVSSLLNKTKPTMQRGKLELEGIGKEGEDMVSESSSISVAHAQSFISESSKKREPAPVRSTEPAKNDLSDLAALINRNKSAKVQKEKKVVKKKPKTPKSSKKQEIKVDPENIDFNAFNTPEMLQHMDDELKQLIQQQNPESTPEGNASTIQNVDIPQVAAQVPPEKKNAYTPAKPKKPTKQELAKTRAEARKSEKKRKEEEKKTKEEEKLKREEELQLQKEKEEEQTRARQEAETKQQAIEEETLRRLAEEDEARREEEEAMEKLKDTKRKAREEREQRRAAEAERRKLEVQRKREEKKRKEEEMREKEKEMEQTKVDQEKRRQELMETKRRQDELDRLEEERRVEDERLSQIEDEEEQRKLEEEQIREAEEELQRLQEEREYKEQMRRIAEAREQKLKEEEEERLRKEEEERLAEEEEKRKIHQHEEKKAEAEKKRFNIARRLEAVARMRIAHEAAKRKTKLLRRREANLARMDHLRNVRQDQSVTRAHVFSYYIRIPRQVWEVPIGFSKQKKGFRGVKKKPPPKNT